MRLKTRERAIRIVLASLLESDLTKREIMELAESLTNHSFAWELADVLRNTLKSFTDFETTKQLTHPSNDFEELAYELVQHRRLRKGTLIEYINLISPRTTDRMARSNATVREILSEFFDAASRRKAERLLELLQGAKKSDAYLKGIIQRD